jgi:hypothetical protein
MQYLETVSGSYGHRKPNSSPNFRYLPAQSSYEALATTLSHVLARGSRDGAGMVWSTRTLHPSERPSSETSADICIFEVKQAPEPACAPGCQNARMPECQQT